MSNTDHFSTFAAAYAKSRPSYPSELFSWLAEQCSQKKLAWDCGTGNGQAAHELASHFDMVHATDLSPQQIAQTTPNPRVHFLCAPAQASGLENESCDLVTVAQALHWFCHDPFYSEVDRVLKPGGVIAAWTYTLLDAEPSVNMVIKQFHDHTVGPWWPPERKWVDLNYVGMPFPFEEFPAPLFIMSREWTLEHLLDYVNTWSAVQRYRSQTGRDAMLALRKQLESVWGDPNMVKTIRWPLAIRCGKKKL